MWMENVVSGILFSPDYPEAAGEDIDFCLKILQAGLGINASDSVSVFHWYGYSENAACNLAIFKRRFEVMDVENGGCYLIIHIIIP